MTVDRSGRTKHKTHGAKKPKSKPHKAKRTKHGKSGKGHGKGHGKGRKGKKWSALLEQAAAVA